MLPFESIRLLFLGFQIGVDLRLVGVIAGKGRVNLCQREVAELPYDLFRNRAHVVPLSYPANRDPVPAMHGRPPRMSECREIKPPIPVTVVIEFQYSARRLACMLDKAANL